jgi:hypothetical protein
MKSKLILSNAKGYKLDDVKNWILSAKEHQTDYDIALILADENREIIDFCEFNGIWVFPYWTVEHQSGQDYFYGRCKLVSKACRSLEGVEYVLLTDVRDVIFQEDPFPKYIAKLGDKDAVLSSENILISNEPWNQNVLFQLFGGEACDRIRDHDVINSGVIFGRPQFLADLNLLMYDITHCLTGEKIRDQAALQYLYHSIQFINQRCIVSDGNDFIATHLAVAGPTKFYNDWNFKHNLKCGHAVMDREKVLCTHPDGQVYSIVHQYNRCEEWNQWINNKYTLNMLKSYKPAVDKAKVACVVCSTPSFNVMYGQYGWDQTIKSYPDLKLIYDCTIKQDLKQEIKFEFVQENLLFYDLKALESTFNRTEPPDLKHRWADGGSRNINWFFPHLRMLYYYLAHPDYDYYWFMDDDCSFIDGSLNDLLSVTSYTDADCIITYIFTEGDEKQEGTHFAGPGMSCYHGDHCAWFHWYPGPGDIMPEGITKKYGSYFPFVRLSKGALMKLWELHQQGYIGYSEGYVPTVLNHYGFKLHSLNATDASLNFETPNKVRIAHKKSEVQWKHL